MRAKRRNGYEKQRLTEAKYEQDEEVEVEEEEEGEEEEEEEEEGRGALVLHFSWSRMAKWSLLQAAALRFTLPVAFYFNEDGKIQKDTSRLERASIVRAPITAVNGEYWLQTLSWKQLIISQWNTSVNVSSPRPITTVHDNFEIDENCIR